MKPLVALLLVASSAALAQSLPPPTIVSMSPSAVTAPSPGITILVTGTRFRQDSKVVWRYGALGAIPLETTFLGETQLRAAVPANLVQDPGQIPVAVTQPGDPGQTLVSNTVIFAVFSGLSVATICPLPNAIVGQPYSQTFAPNGGLPPYTWTLIGGALPAGLSLATSGQIGGSPTVAQTSAFTVQVTDAGGNSARSGCAITSIAGTGSQSLFITSIQPSGILAGSGPAAITIRGQGFTSSSVAVWSFGSSPVDLATTFVDINTLTASVPATLTAAPGTYQIVVRQTVLTAQSLSNPQPFTISAPLTISNGCPLRDAVLGAGYSEQLAVNGGFAPYVWSVFSGQLPPGLALQREGTLSGTPNVAGEFNFAIAVTDARNNTGTRACSMRVLGPVSAFPTSLAFNADSAGEWPGARDISVIAAAPNVAYSVTSSGGAWLRVSSTTFATPGIVRVFVEPAQLPPGVYAGVITIRAADSSNQAVSVPVSLTLAPARDPALVPRPRALRFSAPREGTRTLTQLLTVGAAAPGPLSFAASAESVGNWLSVSPAGNATPSSPANLRVTVSPAGLGPGTYTGTIRLAPVTRPERVEVPVVLTIGLSLETLLTSQSGITITSVAGGPNPSNRSVHVTSSGPNGFFWDASPSTASGGDWLQLVNANNFARPGELSTAEIRTRSIDLGAGLYFGDLRINTASADLPRNAGIAVEVLPPDRALPLELSAASLLFVAPSTAPRALTVRNISRTPVQTVLSLNGDSRIWSITNGDFRSLLSSDSQTVSVLANPAGLGPGVYRAALLLQGSGAPVTGQPATPTPAQTVDLMLIVPPADCDSAAPLMLPVSPGSGFRATSGLPLAVEIDLIDACGRPVDTGAATMFTPGTGRSGVALQSFGAGRYAATWNVPDRESGPATLAIHAWDAASRAAQPLTITGQIDANPGVPVIGEDSILSAASLRIGAPLAPGGIFSLFGARLAVTALPARSVPLPNQLGSTRITIGPAEGDGVPLFFAGPSQANAMLPFSLTSNAIHQVAVTQGTMRSAYIDIAIAPASPAVFTFAQSGSGQGIIVDGARPTILAAPASPVARGGIVVIYCEGLGLNDRFVAAGQASPASPAAQPLAQVSVTIGGQPATVLFAGLTPDSVGLSQINVIVPAGIVPGDAVPVVVTASGLSSRTVTIAVQ